MAQNETKPQTSLTVSALLILTARTLAYVFGFALPLLLVRRLDPAQFGLYKQAFLVVNDIVSLLPLGFMMSTYYFLPREPPERQPAVISNVLVFYFTLGAAALGLSLIYPQWITWLLGQTDGAALTSYAPLIGATILFWIGSSYLEVVTLARQEARLATVFIVIAQVAKTSFLLVAAIFFGSVRALLWAALLQGVLQAIILQVYLQRRYGNYWSAFDFALLRKQLSYALPIGGSGLLFYLLVTLHNYYVSYRFGAVVFGAYSLGSFVIPLVSLIGMSVTAVVIPRISHLQAQNSTREILETTLRAWRKLAALYLPIYAFMFVMGREIILFLFTEKFIATLPIFLINLTLVPFMIFMTDPIMRAYAEHRFYLFKTRLLLLPMLGATLWWTSGHYGTLGAITTAVAFIILDQMIECQKALSIVGMTRRDWRQLADVPKIALAVGCAALVTAGLRYALPPQKPFFILLWCGICFSALYAALLLALRVLDADERQLLARYTQRFLPRSAD